MHRHVTVQSDSHRPCLQTEVSKVPRKLDPSRKHRRLLNMAAHRRADGCQFIDGWTRHRRPLHLPAHRCADVASYRPGNIANPIDTPAHHCADSRQVKWHAGDIAVSSHAGAHCRAPPGQLPSIGQLG